MHTSIVYDDGSGPALYAGGRFRNAAGIAAEGIAKWDGAAWTSLGEGIDGSVSSLAVFDNGSGPVLVVGGYFTLPNAATSMIASWNGTSWSALSGGDHPSGIVSALTVFDDGSGPALYAGGNFIFGSSGNIRRWDGSTWSSLAGGLFTPGDFDSVHAMTVFDDGTGAALYVGGYFSNAGTIAASHIAKWDGLNWSPLGSGVGDFVSGLTVFDDGGGPELFATGSFEQAGGTVANGIAKWNGSSWSALGGSLDSFSGTITVFDDGGGSALYLGGVVTDTAGTTGNFARFQSTGLQLLSPCSDISISSLTEFDDGSGATLFAGGQFTTACGVPAHRMAQWSGTTWSPLGRGLDAEVIDLEVFNDGAGEALYAAGQFLTAGAVDAESIAKWDGSSWAPLGAGVSGGQAIALAVFDDGTGSALFAGGGFTSAGGAAVNRIAKWDGTVWSTLGSGVSGGWVMALEVFDDGTGPALFAGGPFTSAGGVAAKHIAKWDGTNWTALGSSIDPGVINNWGVRALQVFDDGGGPALFASGVFTNAGGVVANNIAKWDGLNWSALGSGTGGQFPVVYDLDVFDDGTGAALYAGGTFLVATPGGGSISKLARWNGANWAPVGGGIVGSGHRGVYTLGTFDDGSGEALYAGGLFDFAGGYIGQGGILARNIAKWSGSSWSALGSGTNSRVLSLAAFDDGGGDALYAGGSFSSAIDTGDSFIAKWGCAGSRFTDLCNGDGGNQSGCTDCPCSNNAATGTVGGCLNSAGEATRITARGDPSVSLPPGATTDLRFSLDSAPSTTVCMLLSGSAVAPQNPANPCFGANSGLQAMAQDGLRCAVMNVKRHGTRQANFAGTIDDSSGPSRAWGGEAQPGGGLALQGGFVAGQSRYFQVIYREDPISGCMSGLNSSQAIEVLLTP